MPTKSQVLEALRATGDYEGAGRLLGIPSGQAYLIATGVPADGSPPARGGDDLLSSGQRLVNASQHNPLRKPYVAAWVRERAQRDLTRPAARNGRRRS
jgi:hypothetical protein